MMNGGVNVNDDPNPLKGEVLELVGTGRLTLCPVYAQILYDLTVRPPQTNELEAFSLPSIQTSKKHPDIGPRRVTEHLRIFTYGRRVRRRLINGFLLVTKDFSWDFLPSSSLL